MTSLDPRLFGPSPARDARFQVKEFWHEMVNLPEGHPELVPEFLHRQMAEEIEGLELTARNLADFPDAPWELRMSMARQCADEARHIEMFRRGFERRGRNVGDYPILTFQYRILSRIESLIGRIAVQNRSFEAAGLDAIETEVASARARGDVDLQELFEMQLADEIQHVRYANLWVKALIEGDGPRSILELSRAVAQANEALRIVAGEGLMFFPICENVRREAGFTDAEIMAARAQMPPEPSA